MADAAVEFLLNNLRWVLLIHHSHLNTDERSEIESLMEDLRLCRVFLQKSRRSEDEQTQALVRVIRDVVYEVEDTIDVFLTQVATTKRPLSRFSNSPASLRGIGKKVEEVKKRVENSTDRASLTVDDEDYKAPAESREKLVGFEDVTSEVVRHLTEKPYTLDVITLVGISGVGKTALARKIFNHPEIKKEFETRIWFHVLNEFTKKDFLLTILIQLSMDIEDLKSESDEVLTKLVFSHLKSRSFLIVLNELWSVSDWNMLKNALPESSSIKKGKVLITTCNEEVGRLANRSRQPLRVHPLSESESWELLQLKVFGETTKCPPELEAVGKLIAKQCEGLPLATVTVGGILARENLSTVDIETRKATWIRECGNVSKYRSKKIYDHLPAHLKVCFLYLAVFPYDFEIPVGQLICMWIAEGFVGDSNEETAESYLHALIERNLLKVCQVKDNGRVKTCRIDRMLHDFCKTEAGKEREDLLTEIKFNHGASEPRISQVLESRRVSIHSNVLDFLSSKPSGPHVRSFVSFSTEEFCVTEEDISAVLPAFTLLRVLDAKPIKFCTLPRDMYHLLHLRYLALSSSITLLPASFSKLWNIQTLLVDTTSRTLDVEPDILEFTQLRHFKTNASANLSMTTSVKGKGGGGNLQSQGSISPERRTDESLDGDCIPMKLNIRGKLSRILEGKSGPSFDNLSKSTSFKGKGGENLQSLSAISPERCTDELFDGAPDLKKSCILGCFEGKSGSSSDNLSKTTSIKGKGGENLQSLGAISPERCTDELIDRARNLKKLGIRGKLSLLLEGKSGSSFDNFARLGVLENLKLLNDVYPLPPSGGRELDSLPQAYKFPPKLKSLTLAGTYLDWSKMSTLGLLENLEVLKLKERAFIGQIWEVEEGGFRNLKALHIARTDLVIWVASAHHFPRLRSLKLRHCQQLQEVPTTLADIPYLSLLELFETKLAAEASAETFLKMREICLKDEGMDVEYFKLSVYP